MNKARKITTLTLSFLLLIITFATSVLGLSFKTALADSGGDYLGQQAAASEGTQTMYYLSIPLKNKKVYIADKERAGNTFRYDKKMLADIAVMQTATIVFVYNNIKAGDYSLITTWNVRVSAVSKGVFLGYVGEVTFFEDIEINIRSEYYEYFKDGDFSKVTMTLLYKAEGYVLYNEKMGGYWLGGNYEKDRFHSLDAKALQREVPDDYDWLEAEGQIGDNGGLVNRPATSEENILLSLYDFLVDYFGLDMVFDEFVRTITIAGASIVALIAIALLFSILSALFPKK